LSDRESADSQGRSDSLLPAISDYTVTHGIAAMPRNTAMEDARRRTRTRRRAHEDASMSGKPETIDEYLTLLSDEKRAALQKLRKDIQSAAPGAQECISYKIPAFRLGGKLLVAFGAAAKHCAFYPGAYPVRACKEDLGAYDTSKGTVRFPPDRPLPTALVRRLVKARIAERAAGE
jgi:uncharacterized protein YdhG (YjbR/CyaY superfamily)